MKHNHKTPYSRALPASAKRVMHPVLGVRCWLVNCSYFVSRDDYARCVTLEVDQDKKSEDVNEATVRTVVQEECPACSGVGHYLVGEYDETCPECEGTGHE